MMYVHFCQPCNRVFMLNGHNLTCPNCHDNLSELKMPYSNYVTMDMDERKAFKAKCEDEYQLNKISTTYRMHKYSKWYRDKQKLFV